MSLQGVDLHHAHPSVKMTELVLSALFHIIAMFLVPRQRLDGWFLRKHLSADAPRVQSLLSSWRSTDAKAVYSSFTLAGRCFGKSRVVTKLDGPIRYSMAANKGIHLYTKKRAHVIIVEQLALVIFLPNDGKFSIESENIKLNAKFHKGQHVSPLKCQIFLTKLQSYSKTMFFQIVQKILPDLMSCLLPRLLLHDWWQEKAFWKSIHNLLFSLEKCLFYHHKSFFEIRVISKRKS